MQVSGSIRPQTHAPHYRLLLPSPSLPKVQIKLHSSCLPQHCPAAGNSCNERSCRRAPCGPRSARVWSWFWCSPWTESQLPHQNGTTPLSAHNNSKTPASGLNFHAHELSLLIAAATRGALVWGSFTHISLVAWLAVLPPRLLTRYSADCPIRYSLVINPTVANCKLLHCHVPDSACHPVSNTNLQPDYGMFAHAPARGT